MCFDAVLLYFLQSWIFSHLSSDLFACRAPVSFYIGMWVDSGAPTRNTGRPLPRVACA